MLDLDRPITTRNGRKVRIICRDSRAKTGPLAVLIRDGAQEYLRSYARNGRRHISESPSYDSNDDLINERTKVKRWKVTYSSLCPGTPPLGSKLYRTSAIMLLHETVLYDGGETYLALAVSKMELIDVYEDELKDDE